MSNIDAAPTGQEVGGEATHDFGDGRRRVTAGPRDDQPPLPVERDPDGTPVREGPADVAFQSERRVEAHAQRRRGDSGSIAPVERPRSAPTS